jgi:SAM-dependent methyltransferase
VTDGPSSRFEPGVARWLGNLGQVRDEVRQTLVHRQLVYHLPDAPPALRVLDAGCGQGTQALLLARLGHEVTGVDLSSELLRSAREAAARETAEVRGRVRYEEGDVLSLDPRHSGAYDLACCHGVAMYLPSLDAVAAALVGATRAGGLISILTRNRFGIAMRAGMSRNWPGTLAGFDARTYDNRVGIRAVRADEPVEVQEALAKHGATTIGWYGVRLFTDHWDAEKPGPDWRYLVAAEEEAGRRDPYRLVAALTHTIARVQ